MSIDPFEILQSFRAQLPDNEAEREARTAKNTEIANLARALVNATEQEVVRKNVLIKARAAKNKKED